MTITKPSYYDDFRCLAGVCPDSCCQEWDVQVDAASAEYYRSLPGELGDKLRQKLQKDEDGDYTLQITDRRCPMWRADGLCDIQFRLGEAALCQVCRDFPRLRHDYGDFVELGLELSCPEAARLILTAPPQPSVTESAPGGTEPEYDRDAMEILLRTRQTALQILTHPLPRALSALLLYGYQVQEELDGGEITEWNPDSAFSIPENLIRSDPGRALREFYQGLDILTPRWEALLQNPAPHQDWPKELAAMARYGVERYWLQAVSDYDLICRVKLIIASCLLVRELGGDLIETAQLYSKEIENSAENVDAILDGAYRHPALTDVNLLSMIQS